MIANRISTRQQRRKMERQEKKDVEKQKRVEKEIFHSN